MSINYHNERRVARKIATGFARVDHLAPLCSGDLMILASRPGHGSVAFALKLCLNVVRQSVPVLWFGLAHSAEDLMGPLLAAKGPEPARMAAAAMELAELPFSVVDSTGSTLSRIRDLTLAWRSKHEQERSVVVVDALPDVPPEAGLPRSKRPFSEVERAHQRALASGLKDMAKATGVAVIGLGRHQAAERLPELADLQYGVDEYADVVSFLHRERSSCRLIVAKQNNGPVGIADVSVELHPKFRFVSDFEAAPAGGHYGP